MRTSINYKIVPVTNLNKHLHYVTSGDHGSTVVKVLCYKSEGRWFYPCWCQWIFHWHKIVPIALWPWGRLNLLQKWVPGISPSGKGSRCVRLTTSHHPVPLSQNLRTLTSSNPLGLSGPVMGLLYLYLWCKWNWIIMYINVGANSGSEKLWTKINTATSGKLIIPLNAELNPLCHLLALLGAHHILHVSRIRVKAVYASYVYIYPELPIMRRNCQPCDCNILKASLNWT